MSAIPFDKLLAAARAGSPDAIETLLAGLRPYLILRAAAELAPDLRAKAGPSDLAQETLRKAWQALPEFRGTTEAELKSWLLAILRRQAADIADRYRAQKRSVKREKPLDFAAQAAEWSQLLSREPSPSSAMRRREEHLRLQAAYDRLPSSDQQLISWKLSDKKTFPEIAALLGCTEAAARKRWLRSVERWKQKVAALYETD